MRKHGVLYLDITKIWVFQTVGLAEIITPRRLAKTTTYGHSRNKGRANLDPALLEQELESGSIPQIQEGSGFMHDYERRRYEEKYIEILYSVMLPTFNQLFFVSWSCRGFHF